MLLLAYAVAVVEHVEARAAARLLDDNDNLLILAAIFDGVADKIEKHLLYFVSVGVYPQPLFDVAAEIVAAVVKVELFDDAFHQLGKIEVRLVELGGAVLLRHDENFVHQLGQTLGLVDNHVKLLLAFGFVVPRYVLYQLGIGFYYRQRSFQVVGNVCKQILTQRFHALHFLRCEIERVAQLVKLGVSASLETHGIVAGGEMLRALTHQDYRL